MRIPDELIAKYLRLADAGSGARSTRRARPGATGSVHPNEAKRAARARGRRPVPRRGAPARRPRSASTWSTASTRSPTRSPASASRRASSATKDGVRVVYVPALLEAMGLVGEPIARPGGCRRREGSGWTGSRCLRGDPDRRRPAGPARGDGVAGGPPEVRAAGGRRATGTARASNSGSSRRARLTVRPGLLSYRSGADSPRVLERSDQGTCVCRTLRTEQRVKSRCLPRSHRHGSPCLGNDGTLHPSRRKRLAGKGPASGASLGGPNSIKSNGPTRRLPDAISTESLILAQDERWRCA